MPHRPSAPPDTPHQPAPWRASLRLRLLLLGFLVVLPAFGLISWSAYENRRERLQEAEQQAERVADRIAAEYGQLVDFTHATLRRLTELPEIRQPRDPAACGRRLAEVRKLNPAYGLIGVVDPSGHTVCAAEPAGLGVYLGDRDYVRQALATGRFVASGFLVGRTTGMNIMVLAEPVLDDHGHAAAVVFLSLDLDWVGRQMQRMAVPPGSNVALVDGAGTVMALYPTNPAAVGQKIPEIRTFLAQSPSGRVRGVRLVGRDRVSRVYVSVMLPRAPAGSAFVRAGIPTAAIIARADHALQRNLLGLAGVAALAFAAAWWMAGLLVVTPTRRLIAAAEALGHGNMAARSQLKHGADELGQLALHFDATAAHLQRVTRALRTLGAGNRCLLRAVEERALLEEMCRIAVQEGGYRLAWVGYATGDAAGSITLAAIDSADDALRRQVETLAGILDDDPATLAIRLGTTQVLPGFAPSQTPASVSAALALLAVCALPLSIGGETIGALTFYADDAESFDAAEHELLEKMAADLAFGIATLRERAERAALTQELAYLSTHDRLTGLPGRTLLTDRLQQALAQARRHQRRTAVACLDVDNFRQVNSSLGAAFGDAVLQKLARRLRGLLPDDDTVARLGSGEFVLLLTDREGVADTADTLLRVLAAVREPMHVEDRDVAITASIGCSFYPDDGDDPELLLQRAKVAMHIAKEVGRDTLKFFAAGFDAAATERIELETDLRRAVPRGELLLHYQPQLDLRSGQLVGFEALMRWQHPRRGLIPPGKFIPIAEDSGLIVALGEWALQEACRQARLWQDAGIAGAAVAVNLSPRQFRDERIVDNVRRILADTGLEPSRLELEITESAIMHDINQVIAIMAEFKALGVILSIDDFGIGYSNLNHLRRFPVDKLKIDQSFVRDVEQAASAAAVARAIIALGHSLRLRVIAEGVETVGQATFLRHNGCDEIQGFLIARPQPARQIEDLLANPPTLPWAS